MTSDINLARGPVKLVAGKLIAFDADNRVHISVVIDLVEVVEAMARFDGRNNNVHLKQMAKDALKGFGK